MAACQPTHASMICATSLGLGGCDAGLPVPPKAIGLPPLSLPVSPVRILASFSSPPEHRPDGLWHYAFELIAMPWDVSFYTIPVFADAGIQNLQVPEGWRVEASPVDALGLGHGAGSLTFIPSATSPSVGVADGFSFDAAMGSATWAPARLDTVDGTVFHMTLTMPLSPNAMAAGLVASASAVPEPSDLALLGFGLVAWVRIASQGRLSLWDRRTKNADA